jgi:cellulase/cellobiase CelA1
MTRSRLLAFASAFALFAAVSIAAFATPASAQQAGGCVATYQLVNGWPGGFQAHVTVTNVSDATSNGWEVTLDFPDDHQIRPPWGYGIPPFPGDPVRIRNAPWNGALPPNASVTFGILGTYTSVYRPPIITCTLL